LLDGLETAKPGKVAIAARFAAALIGQALTTALVQGPAVARPLLTHAFELLSPRVTSGGDARSERELLSEALWYLARIDRALDQPAEAARADAQAAALWEGRPAAELAGLALKEVGKAALVGYGKTPISARARAVRDLDLDLAAAHLRLAVSGGFADLKMLEANPDFGVLLTHAVLNSLIQRLGYHDRAARPKP
jgi:hypothetical protein